SNFVQMLNRNLPVKPFAIKIRVRYISLQGFNVFGYFSKTVCKSQYFYHMAKHLKKIGCLLVIFLVAAGIFSLRLFSDDTGRRTVTVVFFEYPPYTMMDSKTGRPTGYYIDILEAVAKLQNFEIKYVRTLFVDYRNSIPKGKPYIMGMPILITPERQRVYNFSWPCDEHDTVLVVKKGSPVKKLSDLRRCEIGTSKGILEDYCRKLCEAKKIESYKAYYSTAKLYKELTADRIDAILTDRSIALYFQRLHPNAFESMNLVLFSQYEYAGFPIQKKQEWLLKRVNNGLRQIMNSNEYSRIYRKYFPNAGD
ncbi:MAG: transporter substrate-binding domain-containing protein, partial [Victivallaceae bacterium]